MKSEDNVLYDMKTHDCVGIWNELTKKIDEIPDEDEDDWTQTKTNENKRKQKWTRHIVYIFFRVEH